MGCQRFTGGLLAGMLLSLPVLADPLDPVRQQQLRHLLRQDCGSCHGMTLQGGLGPDLQPERMARIPKEYLFAVIAKGVPDTPMPPWESLLSTEEIRWLVQQLQQGAP